MFDERSSKFARIIAVAVMAGLGAITCAITVMMAPAPHNPSSVSAAGGMALLNANGAAMPWASATNLTAALNSSQLLERGPRWSVASNPGASSQGSASKAAGAAGVRHVVDCISFAASVAASAPTATVLRFDVRDGASGAGTIIWSLSIEIPVTTTFQSTPPHSVCGLNLIGSSATAMTAEFSAAITNVSQSANISGYDVQ